MPRSRAGNRLPKGLLPLLGGLLALLSALTFAATGVTARRGVLTGSVFQAVAISVPIGVPIFTLAVVASGNLPTLLDFPASSVAILATSGAINFLIGRYNIYRATRALGSNLSGPIEQVSLVIALTLSVGLLDDHLTVLRALGIGLVLAAPTLTFRGQFKASRRGGVGFQPHYGEGLLFGGLAALSYGLTTLLVKLGVGDRGIGFGLAGGLISYLSATTIIGLIALLPGRWAHLRSIDPEPAKWFTISGLMVGIAQVSRYAALGVAPISIVQPIQSLTVVFRFLMGWAINREHEVYGGRIVLATVLALTGALALTLSAELVQSALPLSDGLASLLRWRWP